MQYEQQLAVLIRKGGSREQPSAAANAAVREYEINDHPLIDFLRWVSREMGWDVYFGSPESERVAQEIIMQGSIRGLSPAQALSAVLTTTRLRSSQEGSRLRIDLRTDDL